MSANSFDQNQQNVDKQINVGGDYVQHAAPVNVTVEVSQTQSQSRNNDKNSHSSLPQQPYFFGRVEELKRIADALDPESRGWGVLIDGPGGMGKTWLAVRAGHLATHFQRKIFLSAKIRHLTATGEETLEDFLLPNFIALITDLARELGHAEVARMPENERAAEVKRALAGQNALVIVDNLETFGPVERNRLYQFLNRLPETCKAIVTSRRRTDIDARIIRLDRLDQDSALLLLAELAHNNRTLARASDDDRRALYGITQGNPLLLRWTAGQLGRGQCRSVAAACEYLKNAPPDNDPLEYIFGDLLDTFTPEETAVLAALSLFTQPAQVQWIAEIAGLAAAQAQTALEDLQDRALLVSDATQEHFLLPPLAAAFLRRKCPEVVAQAGQRLSDKVYALVLENGGFYNHDRYPGLEKEWSVIADALPVFLDGDNERLQKICNSLFKFMDVSGRWDELLDLLQQAESKAQSTGDLNNAGSRVYQAGYIYCRRAQTNEVLGCVERVSAYWRQTNIGTREKALLIQLRGHGYRLQKNWLQAISTYQESLALRRILSPKSVDVAIGLSDLADAEKDSGDYPAAERDYRESLLLTKKVGYREGIAYITGNLADLMLKQECWDEAETRAREALALAEAVGRQELIASDCQRLAQSLARQGRAAEGLPHARRAVEIYTRLRIKPEDMKKAEETLRECESGAG